MTSVPETGRDKTLAYAEIARLERQLAQAAEREADLSAVNENLRTRLEAEGKRTDALLESAAVEDAYCLAEDHAHKNRVEEAICSLRFQRDREKIRAEKAEADNAGYKSHLGNALRQAKEACPDYPWTASPTMSEIAWAVCSSLQGVGLACGDWRDEDRRLREALTTISEWPFDIMGDCVADARRLAAEALAAKEGEG
ncbi:MAG TPA: hypothetical protein VMY35_19950 [Phycisphaerae bacterium]|nr:hypothetical protein [Phycisphaerae bacterium]